MTGRRLVALTEAQTATRPWATARYLRRLVAERRIPFHKIGARLYFDESDLEAFEEANRIEVPHRRPLTSIGRSIDKPAPAA